MTRGNAVLAASVVALFQAAAAVPIAAQPLDGRVTFEGVAAATTTASEPGDPRLVFDGTATGRVGHGIDLVIRPYAHRLPGGDWTAEMYQLQVRYEPPSPLRLRVDAGILAAPIGQASLETLPDRNPTIGGPFFLYSPLPAFSTTRQNLVVMSAGYPVGVLASASGDRWDLRGGVIDQTPARRRNPLASSRPPAAAQIVAGGGVSPWPGLRVGAGWAQGEYDTSRHLDATVFNVEADAAVGYTRLAGEWIQDRFDDPAGVAVVHAVTAEVVRTLSPRWFAAVRGSHVRAPALHGAALVREAASGTEETIGYRLNPQITVKAGHQGSRRYGASSWDHALAVSLVVARRWW